MPLRADCAVKMLLCRFNRAPLICWCHRESQRCYEPLFVNVKRQQSQVTYIAAAGDCHIVTTAVGYRQVANSTTFAELLRLPPLLSLHCAMTVKIGHELLLLIALEKERCCYQRKEMKERAVTC
jgi:hypothetical protein